MARKPRISGALLLSFLLTAASVPALEKSIELGRDALWQDMMSLDGLTRLPGRWGFQDLTLAGGAYAVDGSTELLLHFDGPSARDATGAYALSGNLPVISTAESAEGTGSAAFRGSNNPLQLQGPPGSMFSRGQVWGDFTVEFWLYPATLAEGEQILGWTGYDRSERGSDGRELVQQLRCTFRDRRLVWEFQNLFRLPGAGRLAVRLAGTRQLLPRVWHHHLLRFDSRTGLLEYRLDGLPEAITHVTDTGGEGGSIAVPVLGTTLSGPLQIGAGYTGFLDELRISRRDVEDPVLTRFLGASGVAVSRVIDLGYSDTRVLRIESVGATPSDSGIELAYQAANTWSGKRLLKSDADWVPFTSGTSFGDTLKARYLQLRVELYPDGTRTESPRLSSLRIVYEPNLPPSAPVGVMAVAGNGKVTLSWRAVNDLTAKGYLVYYGSSPHTYLGTGAAQGASPIDVGSSTRAEIGGLDNGELYYFAVVSYDASEPRQQSPFSAEVSARPSRIYSGGAP